jgi:uncharacterized protein involved in exopolysaccharide biosynthesis
MVVRSFLIVFLISIVAAFALPKQYQAEMKILVKRERVDPAVSSNKATLFETHSEVTEEQVQSEVELFKSRDLLERVVKECGLVPGESGKTLNHSSTALATAVRNLQSALQVEPIRKTNLISATYRSADPELAARVLNELANLYLEKHLEVHRLPGAFDFFEKQTERYRSELTTSEQQIINYDRDTGVASPELEKEMTLRKESEFEAALRETTTGIAEVTERIRSLELQMSTTSTRITTQERSSDNPMLLEKLRTTLLTLELKRTELLTKFAPDYPTVREVEKQIAQTQATIAATEQTPVHEQTTDSDPTYTWLREELAKNRTQLIALRARAQALAPVVEAYRNKSRSLDEKGVTQQDLIRNNKAAEENYLLYLQKQEEARIADALDRNRIVNVAVAESAAIPVLPIRSRLFVTLLGALLAVLISVGLAFGADYLDPSFRTPQELRDTLDIPVLAAVPREIG